MTPEPDKSAAMIGHDRDEGYFQNPMPHITRAAPPEAAPAEPQVMDLTLGELFGIIEQAGSCEACGQTLLWVALREIRRGERPNRLRHEVCS